MWHRAGLTIAPLLVLGVAWVLWVVSDRLLWIGPLDRAAFGWLVVVPLLVLAVPLATEAWHGLDRRGRMVGALALAGSVAAVVATLFARALFETDCQYGMLVGPAEILVRSIGLGIAVGAAYGIGALVVSGIGRRWSVRRWVIGTGVGVGILGVGLLAFVAFMPFALCARS